MLDRGLGVVFDREVVDDQGEDDTVSGMLEEAGSVATGIVVVTFKKTREFLKGESACLGEAVEALLDAHQGLVADQWILSLNCSCMSSGT